MIKVTSALLENISRQAADSVRKRKNYNFHKEDSDKLQRMLNAIEPETYIRPHKHANPDKREIFILLKGKMAIVEFDEEGKITDTLVTGHETGNYCAEVTPGCWHTVISLEHGTVYYEIKDGPYDASNDKIFAEWSPEEGSEKAIEYVEKIRMEIGEN